MNLLSKTVLVSVLVSLAVVIGGFYFADVGKKLAAVSGPDIDFPYQTINGVGRYYVSQPMAATSSSICLIQNPYATTTVLENFSAFVTGNAWGANQTVDLSTSTTALISSSSTPPLVLAFPINTEGGVFSWYPSTATTTKSGGASGNGVLEAFNSKNGTTNAILRSGEVITLKIATATPSVVTNGGLTGTCNATFRKL